MDPGGMTARRLAELRRMARRPPRQLFGGKAWAWEAADLRAGLREVLAENARLRRERATDAKAEGQV